MSHTKSDAAHFRREFERAESGGQERRLAAPDRHPSMHQVRIAENGGGKSFAALFRGVFEKALEDAQSGQQENREAPGLAHYGKGRPVIIEVDGAKRYVYADGSVDGGSVVSPEVEARAFEIGGIAVKTEEIAEDIPQIDMAEVEAASLYGLHGEGLDEAIAAGLRSPMDIVLPQNPSATPAEAQAA